MFIENKELKGLIEKEQELMKDIEPQKAEVKELTERMQAIQDNNKAKTDEISKVRAEIAKIFVPIALEKLGETEMFGEVTLKDGKPFVKVVDVSETALEDAKAGVKATKKDWEAYIEKLNKTEDVVKAIKKS